MIDIFVGVFCLETTIGVGLAWLPVGAHFAFRPTCWGIPLLFGFGLSLFLSRARIPKDIVFLLSHLSHLCPKSKQKRR